MIRSIASGPFFRRWPIAGLAAVMVLMNVWTVRGETVARRNEKMIIGPTAGIKEESTGLEFEARIDTGATSCSIHVEKWEIENPDPDPVENVGKPIRFLVANDAGDSAWIESTIASRVRIISSSQKDGAYHGRYKVRLTLQWKDFEKEVLVSLTDRADMEYPLLIGRNFLRGDFLVDVSMKRDQE